MTSEREPFSGACTCGTDPFGNHDPNCPGAQPSGAHVHRWVDKSLLHEPSLKVCECGATMTDTEYKDVVRPERDGSSGAYSHERETLGIALSEAWWCLKGFGYHLAAPLRVLPLCRLGLHDWCRCCSPVNCTRCGASGHD